MTRTVKGVDSFIALKERRRSQLTQKDRLITQTTDGSDRQDQRGSNLWIGLSRMLRSCVRFPRLSS